MCIWNYGFDTRKAVLELIISLVCSFLILHDHIFVIACIIGCNFFLCLSYHQAAVPDKFLDSCLDMLVNNFAPRRKRESIRHPRLAEKRNIYSELYAALHHIADLVPLAPMMLKGIIDRNMPKSTDPKEVLWNH